jgi:hypothetical protein
MGVAAAVAAYAKYQEGQNAAAQNETQAKLQDQQAGDTRVRGQIASGMSTLETGQDLAKQTLAYSGAGVDASVGTPVDVRGDTAALGKLKALDIENNAIREAWGYEQAANVSRSRAKDARAQAGAGVATSLISGAAQMYGANSSLSGGGLTSPASSLASTRGQ